MSATAKLTVPTGARSTVFPVLFGIASAHLLNDMIQSLLPAIYPILKQSYALSFTQVGLLTLTFQLTASLLQPLVGAYTDKHPLPWSLTIGMAISMLGLLLLSRADGFHTLLFAAAMVGLGSSIFHPESSRIARLASGGRFGLAQSMFQVGGNAGTALGPLLAAFVVLRHGQSSVALFAAPALLGVAVLAVIGRWYAGAGRQSARARMATTPQALHSRGVVARAIAVLVLLVFSKYFYLVSISNYFTFYLIERFHLSTQDAQLHLFAFLAAVAAGTLAGGPIGDRFGRKWVIWVSILGMLPFTLALPHADLFWTGVLSVVIGLILSSAFSAILVYATELVPGRVGMIAGLFFGFAFGMGGLGAATLGMLADHIGIEAVYQLCAFLPAIGLLTMFLPKVEPRR